MNNSDKRSDDFLRERRAEAALRIQAIRELERAFRKDFDAAAGFTREDSQSLDNALEALECGRFSRFLLHLLRRWDSVTKEIATGYRGNLDEFRNDMDARMILAELLEAVSGQVHEAIAERIRVDDARFMAATTPLAGNKHIWGRAAYLAGDGFWYRRMPIRMERELEEDLAEDGLT